MDNLFLNKCKALLPLVKQWLVAPVEETDERGRVQRTTRNKDTKRGTPQGAPHSTHHRTATLLRAPTRGCRGLRRLRPSCRVSITSPSAMTSTSSSPKRALPPGKSGVVVTPCWPTSRSRLQELSRWAMVRPLRRPADASIMPVQIRRVRQPLAQHDRRQHQPEHRRRRPPAATLRSCSNWYSFCGMMKVWLASMSEASTIAPPPRPKMPKPGITKISSSRHPRRRRKAMTSSQPAVPPR